MVLKPTTAALPWYPGEENEVTCIALAPFGGRALVGTVSGKCYIVDLGTTLNPKFMPAVDEERRKENDSDEDSETNRRNSDNLAKTPETFKMKEAIRVLNQIAAFNFSPNRIPNDAEFVEAIVAKNLQNTEMYNPD